MKAFPSKRPVIKNLGKFGPVEFKPIIEDGMDLRDYFAAKAMQALINDEKLKNTIIDMNHHVSKVIPKLAYEYANEMIKAREDKHE
jgi:hypothetical protein